MTNRTITLSHAELLAICNALNAEANDFEKTATRMLVVNQDNTAAVLRQSAIENRELTVALLDRFEAERRAAQAA